MAEPIPVSQAIQEDTSSTLTIVTTDTQDTTVPTLHLKLKKPKTDKKVQWTTETVDNEEMNKKKSKCCCIYNKPKKFDDSSSDDSDDECDHCQGHVEKKKHRNNVVDSTTNDPSSVTVLEADHPSDNIPSEPCSDPATSD